MTYSLLIILICIIAIIYIILSKKKLYHPIFIFNLIWLLIIWLESLHLYGLIQSDEKTYEYIFIGILFFNIGCIIVDLYRKNHRLNIVYGNFNKNKGYKTIYEPRYRLLYIIAIIAIIFYLGSAIRNITSLTSGMNFGEIRALVQEENYTNSGIYSKIFNAIATVFIIPGATLVQVVGCICFWFEDKNKIKNKKLFIFAVAIAFLSSIAEGGRTAITNLLIYIILGFFISKAYLKIKDKKISKRISSNGKFYFIAFFLVIFLSWFTFSRTGQTLKKNIYLYFSMQPYMFNVWANKVDIQQLLGYSEASLNGFSFGFLYIIKNIFNIDFPAHWYQIYEMIRLTDSNWQIITNMGTTANAYVSIFWFLYLDGRTIGIIIGMLLYGAYMAHCFNDAIKYTNNKNVTLYAFLFQGLLYTFIRAPFSNIYYAIAYIYIMSIAFKKVKSEE